MDKKKTSFLYKIIRFFVLLFTPRMALVGAENMPEEPCVIVGNHSQMTGPIASELDLPGLHYTWCAGQMMNLKEVPAYAFEDFWSFKPRAVRWLFRLLSYLIAPLSVCIFNNAHTVPVYHDTRLLTTYRDAMQKLREGASMVIFPEYNKKYNNILYEFQDKFIDLARFYYKKTGTELCFVPLYIAPRLKKMFLGKPIRFRHDIPIEEERQRICRYLKEEITALAAAQPKHTVVPYRNIRKRDYPKNIPVEVSYEETCC